MAQNKKKTWFCALETLEPCTYSTTLKGNMNRHILSRHTVDKKHICGICFKSFTRSDYLQKHKTKNGLCILKDTTKRYLCVKCYTVFFRSKIYDIHIKKCDNFINLIDSTNVDDSKINLTILTPTQININYEIKKYDTFINLIQSNEVDYSKINFNIKQDLQDYINYFLNNYKKFTILTPTQINMNTFLM